MSIHTDKHEYAGKTVKVKAGAFAGEDYLIEDWWDRIAGKSWGVCGGNPACLDYAIRTARERAPLDDEVVCGKMGFVGKLIHVSQLGLPEEVESD